MYIILKSLTAISLLLGLTVCLTTFAQPNVVDSLEQIIALSRGDTTEIKALNKLGIEYSRRDLEKSKASLYRSMVLGNKHGGFGLSSAYSQLTLVHQSHGNMDSAWHYFRVLDEFVKISEHQTDTHLYNYYHCAGQFYKNQGNFKEAMPFLLKALDYLTDTLDRSGQLFNIGNNYQNLGQLTKATDYHLQALAGFESVGSKRGRSFALQGLGNDFWKLQQFEKAKDYYMRSLQLKEEMGDKRGMMTAYGALGPVETEMSNYAAAEKYLRQALAIAEEMQLLSEQGRAYNDLAQLYKKKKDISTAKNFLFKNLEVAKQTGDSAWCADIRLDLIRLEAETTDRTKTEQALLRSLQMHNASGDKLAQSKAHEQLAAFYSTTRQFDKAWTHIQQFGLLKDSIQSGEVLLQLRELEEKFRNDQQEKEIALLKKDQELQITAAEKEKAVQAGVIVALISVIAIGLLLVNRWRTQARTRRQAELEQMRNAIARDLHDDIGSTLSSIKILSQLALQENADQAGRFGKIAEHSGRMMESMSDIVWSIDPVNDSLDKVVTRMKEFAGEILEPLNINYRFTGEDSLTDATLNVEKRKNLFLIFKEAVNNAAKYSSATIVDVNFSRSGNLLTLTVADNGCGFVLDEVKRGNGLKNMRARALMLKARFDFTSYQNEGTRVALEMPLT